MQRIFLVFIILLFCPLLIHPQAMNSGSAKTLEGNIYILTCFVSNSSAYRSQINPGPWSHDDKIRYLREKDQALEFLKEEALKYGITINFIENVCLDKDFLFADGAGGGGWYNGILKAIGHNNQEAFYDYVKNNTKCDNSLILVFTSTNSTGFNDPANRGGFAFPQHNASDTNFYLEGVTINKNDVWIEITKEGKLIVTYGGISPNVNVDLAIAHEILHCFGAWDLYEKNNKTTGAELARKRYPKSIMNSLGSRDIGFPEVDPLTAWRIGWNKNPEPWFYQCDPDK